MAYASPRKDKYGKIISYRIREYKGLDSNGKRLKPYSMTWKPRPGMTEKQIAKELTKQIALFEERCKSGQVYDNKQTFAQYSKYVMELKERQGIKRSTLDRYSALLERINEGIGHIKLMELRPQHLNLLYEQLMQNGLRKNKDSAICKIDFKSILSSSGFTQQKLHDVTGVSLGAVRKACQGKTIAIETATAISKALNQTVDKLFNIEKNNTPLSSKTVLEHHRLISTILDQADKELLIPYNPARKATPPKAESVKVNYFDVEDVERIRDCLENENIKWKTVVHLLLISGARRAEIAGLKWKDVDFNNNQIHISRNLLYSPKVGLYEDTTKTKKSDRYINLPTETMELLKEYRRWYLIQSSIYGSMWHNTNYLFFQDKSGNEGMPMHPDSINAWLDTFSKRYGLPHINPHAFRHTMASILYYNGIDSVSISNRLGHSKVSTTTDIYSHIMKKADAQASECIADVVLRPKRA